MGRLQVIKSAGHRCCGLRRGDKTRAASVSIVLINYYIISTVDDSRALCTQQYTGEGNKGLMNPRAPNWLKARRVLNRRDQFVHLQQRKNDCGQWRDTYN